MVTINEDAFAAVHEAFPGALTVNEPSSSASTVAGDVRGTSTATRRQGVGAQKKLSQVEKADIEKRVLQIGRKKRKQLVEDGEDVDDVLVDKDRHIEDYDDGEEDEEGGRTSIVADTKKSPPGMPHTGELVPKKKRKKKNKKKKAEQNEASPGNGEEIGISIHKDESSAEKTNERGAQNQTGTANKATKEIICGVDATTDVPQNQAEHVEGKNSKKRKKKRSRQKNIRKDNRLQKPEHLNPDSKEYKGRPLTAETRRRLNMPESRNARKLKAYWSSDQNPAHSQSKSRGEGDTYSTKNVSVAFLGNSIQYFNDCPRLVQALLRESGVTVRQNSCLRGGATLASLWSKGSGMRNKFSTPTAALPDGKFDIGAANPKDLLQSLPQQQSWDYVLFQDHTQHPARPASRQETLDALKTNYIPFLQQHQATTTILLLQTFAYRVHGIKESQDLGNFESFTQLLVDGYEMYAEQFRHAGFNVLTVPMGRAVQWLYTHRRHDLWKSLYSWDDFHPSPHGTWLQACLITLTLTDGRLDLPVYNARWWDECRYLQPPKEKALPLPTAQEADDLRQVARMVYDSEKKTKEGAAAPAPTIPGTVVEGSWLKAE